MSQDGWQDILLFYLLAWILRGISDEVMILAGMLPAYEGAEEAGDHPLELVPEDAVDDEVDGAVDCHQEVVGLCEGVVDLPEVLKKRK